MASLEGKKSSMTSNQREKSFGDVSLRRGEKGLLQNNAQWSSAEGAEGAGIYGDVETGTEGRVPSLCRAPVVTRGRLLVPSFFAHSAPMLSPVSPSHQRTRFPGSRRRMRTTQHCKV